MRITCRDIVRVTYYGVKEETCQGFSYKISQDDAIAIPTREAVDTSLPARPAAHFEASGSAELSVRWLTVECDDANVGWSARYARRSTSAIHKVVAIHAA